MSISAVSSSLGLSALCVITLMSLVVVSHADEKRTEVDRAQQIVDVLKSRLAIAAEVTATVVPANDLLVSVKPVGDRTAAFELSFEADFLATLDDDDLQAVIAHELGHVWIFTHHPFLQTERQANEVALRVVSRDSLERVYSKVWARGRSKGDPARFLGQ